MSGAPEADEGGPESGPEPAMESITKQNSNLLTEEKLYNNYISKIKNNTKRRENIVELKKADIYNKNFFINEELNRLITELSSYTEQTDNDILEEIINDVNE